LNSRSSPSLDRIATRHEVFRPIGASRVKRLYPRFANRTRNDLDKAQGTQSKANENSVKSTKLTDVPPLITVWLQVRVLPSPPANQWLSCLSFRGLLATAPEMPASLLPVALQHSASYSSGFHPTTISPRNRRFGGIFAMECKQRAAISVIGTTFRRSRTCERNVWIGDVLSATSGLDQDPHIRIAHLDL
jgi:hypothetical protein